MTTIAYCSRAPATKAVTLVVERQGLFSRFLRALVAARMRQFEREIAPPRHLLPRELEQAGNRLNSRNEDALPFEGR
jgi:hypothetical protein